jgi:hypothetical protein
MGEDGYCADQTRYVCGNPVDDPLLDIRGVADTLVPKEKSAVAVKHHESASRGLSQYIGPRQ